MADEDVPENMIVCHTTDDPIHPEIVDMVIEGAVYVDKYAATVSGVKRPLKQWEYRSDIRSPEIRTMFPRNHFKKIYFMNCDYDAFIEDEFTISKDMMENVYSLLQRNGVAVLNSLALNLNVIQLLLLKEWRTTGDFAEIIRDGSSKQSFQDKPEKIGTILQVPLSKFRRYQQRFTEVRELLTQLYEPSRDPAQYFKTFKPSRENDFKLPAEHERAWLENKDIIEDVYHDWIVWQLEELLNDYRDKFMFDINDFEVYRPAMSSKSGGFCQVSATVILIKNDR
jgi:hypothetical protein